MKGLNPLALLGKDAAHEGHGRYKKASLSLKLALYPEVQEPQVQFHFTL